MQNILSQEIMPILPMFAEKLFEYKKCNDYYCHKGKKWEMLKRKS